MAGFLRKVYSRMKLQQIWWALVRLSLLFAAFLCVVTLGSALYLFAPLTSYVCFNDWRFWRHIHKFSHLIHAGAHLAWLWLSNFKNYRSVFAISLFVPPSATPHKNKVRIREDWQHGESCGDCHYCCGKLRCPLVKDGLCAIYGSLIWQYFNCGKYPSTQKEIDYFQCPKWEVVVNNAELEEAKSKEEAVLH